MKNYRIHKSRTKKKSGKDKMDFLSNMERKYQGCFVAFTHEKKPRFLAADKNCGVVIDKAREKGQQSPCVIFVPKKDAICAY